MAKQCIESSIKLPYYRIGICDFCYQENRYVDEGYDAFGVHVVDLCAYGCNDERSIPSEVINQEEQKQELCEVCNKKEYTKLCDHAEGTGIITSVDFEELTRTCDKKLCSECATNIWVNCDLCPEHAEEVKKKLLDL